MMIPHPRADVVADDLRVGDTGVMGSSDERAAVGMGKTIPALPVRDLQAAVGHYEERFGFTMRHHGSGLAVLRRDEAVIHLWEAGDTDWQSRTDFASRPVCSGAESFIAGTASCRIEVVNVDALFNELQPHAVLHRVSREGVTETAFGTREFATLDLDGNLITFFRWRT
jgi:catechol 2,3-dioxygenase-like lactoylglutathione lyase family enzyme